MTTALRRIKQRFRGFRFKPFSRRQMQLITWWHASSPMASADGVIAQGAIRSGKTVAMIIGFLMWSLITFREEGANFIIAGKSIGALKRNVLTPMFKILNAWGISYHYSRSSESPHIVIGKNIYYLFGANNERSQDALQGFTAAGALADEVVLFPESFVDQMIGRCSEEGSKIWMSCNPAGPFHYFKLRFVDKARKKRLLDLHFTLDDNPSLSAQIKARYRRMFTGMWFKRYILGLWALAEGLVYSMFDEDKHFVPPETVPTWFPHYGVAVDHGNTNPTTFGLIAWGAGDGKVYLLNLYYFDSRKEGNRRKTDSQYADDFESWLGPYRSRIEHLVVDPSAGTFITELESRGFTVKKAKNDVKEGIQYTSILLEGDEPIFVVRDVPEMDPCKLEFGTYAWDPKAQQRGEDKPLKENDHIMDMIRYFLFTIIRPLLSGQFDPSKWDSVRS